MFKSNSLTLAISLGAAALFSACVTDNSEKNPYIDTSVTPQEISAKTSGPALVSGVNSGADWSMASSAGETPSVPAVTGNFTLLNTPLTSLKKISANTADNVTGFIWEDTLQGKLTFYATKQTLGKTEYDTVCVKWDAEAKDSINNNEHMLKVKSVSKYLFGKVETVEFLDLDGNGIINPVPKTNNRARIDFSSTEFGITEHAIVDVDAGLDNNFDTEADNLILTTKWTRSQGDMILGQSEFTDGDGDGLVIDNRKESSTVKVSYSEINPKGKPFVKKSEAKATVKVFANKGGDEPISFFAKEELITGRINTITMKNRFGKEILIKDDTLFVTVATEVPFKEDTLKASSITFVMNPGHNLKDESDDSLYAIHIISDKKLGWERHAELNLVSDKAIPHGEKPVSGKFDWKAFYANGKSASAEGSFAPGIYHATFTGPEGNTVKVDYDSAGTLLTSNN